MVTGVDARGVDMPALLQQELTEEGGMQDSQRRHRIVVVEFYVLCILVQLSRGLGIIRHPQTDKYAPLKVHIPNIPESMLVIHNG